MISIHQQSSLAKIFLYDKEFAPPYLRGSGLLGENFSYQLAVKWDGWRKKRAQISVESPIAEHITLYRVGNVPCELPAYPDSHDEDYITTQAGIFPDPLFPIPDGSLEISAYLQTILWVEIKIPEKLPAGEYPVKISVTTDEETAESSFTLSVIGAKLPKQKLIFTQWFHVDCIADAHKVDIYSEEHWRLIESYLRTAAEHGMNMVLTPILTPPLDTEIGGERPCTQLVGIEKNGESYSFDFSKLERFMVLAQRCGIEYFEISHLFSQWGARSAPNIYAVENGEEKRIFGWETSATSEEYRSFLSQLLPELTAFIEEKGLKEKVIFHISDEPSHEQLDSYRAARDAAIPYLEGYPIYDALSNVEFYKSGLVENPIPATNYIEPFLRENIPDLWTYYCCGQNKEVGNRFLAMPSYRNRILGIQLYKFRIKGFLQWGYNFWNTQNSREKIDPYKVTDGGGAFPGGDPFSVYPGEEAPICSLRLKVFLHALQDMRALELLENLSDRKTAESCVENYEEIRFSQYPRSADFLLETREKVNEKISDILKK